MRPDLTTLKLFLAVVEEHSIAKAAAREHITAPAISKRITELETTLSVQLFDRHPKGIRPTAAGEALAADIRSIFAILDRAENKLSEYAAGNRGRIRIHANPSGLSGALPDALNSYLKAHPLVGIQLEEKHSIDVVRAVTEGEADIGIFAPHVPADGLTITPYRRDGRGNPEGRRDDHPPGARQRGRRHPEQAVRHPQHGRLPAHHGSDRSGL